MTPPNPRLARLLENQIDLHVELTDLVGEIESRVARIAVVLTLLRDTHHELALLIRQQETELHD